MHRDDVTPLAGSFIHALMRRDARALWEQFSDVNAVYSDACRPGLSRGPAAVQEHLALLCDALHDATVSHVDTLVDEDRACIRWMAQHAPDGNALDAVTWLRFVD